MALAASRPMAALHSLAVSRAWRSVGAVVSAMLWWALGTWGVRRILAGMGPVVVYGPVAARGGRAILAATLLWSVLVVVVSRRPALVIGSGTLLAVVTIAVTADSVGRALSAFAWASVFVAWWTVAGWRLIGRRHPALWPIAWPAVAVVIVSQLWWSAHAGAAAHVGLVLLLALAVAVSVGVIWVPGPVLEAEALLRQAGCAVVRAVRGAGRRVTASALGLLHRPEAIVGLVALIVTLPAFHRLSQGADLLGGTTDFRIHLDLASQMSLLPLEVSAPHPLYHALVAALALGMGQTWASAVVLAASTGLLAAVLVRFGRRSFAGLGPLPIPLAVAYGLGALVLDTPGLVAEALRIGRPSDWYPIAHMWNSPTETLLVPLAFLLVLLVSDAIEHPARRTARRGRWLLVITVAAMLAKPTFAMVLFPAVPLATLGSPQHRAGLGRFLGRWMVGPAVVVFLWQTWYLELAQNDFGRSSVAIRPLETLRATGLDRPGPLLLVALAPLAAAVAVGGRRFLAEALTRLLLWCQPFALALLMLLNETGRRRYDGNFAKPLFLVNLILFFASWRYLIGRCDEDRAARRLRWWHLPVGALLALSVMAGVVHFLDAAGLVSLAPRRLSGGGLSR